MTPDEKAELRKTAEAAQRAGECETYSVALRRQREMRSRISPQQLLAILDENARLAEQVKVLDCGCGWQNRTGGGHSGDCHLFDPECTCYEVIVGHQPGCYFHGLARHKRTVAELEAENARLAADVERLPKWIPCSERMPEEEEFVLAWDDDGILHQAAWFEAYEPADGAIVWRADSGQALSDATHWMPLPEPPK